jgi:hypothetical protein
MREDEGRKGQYVGSLLVLSIFFCLYENQDKNDVTTPRDKEPGLSTIDQRGPITSE